MSRRDWWLFWLLMAAGAIFRVYLFGSGRLGFESDQAIAGIVALEALEHGHWQLITPGDNYGGQLLSYYMLPIHAVFGASVAAMRLAMIPLSLLVGACAFGCAWVLFRCRAWAFTALALALFSPSMVCEFFMRPAMLYLIPTCATLAGVAAVVAIMRQAPQGVWTRREAWRGFAAGVVIGVAYWTHPIMLQYMAALVLFALCFPRQAWFVFGFAGAGHGDTGWTRNRILTAVFQACLLVSLGLLTYLLLLRRPILPSLPLPDLCFRLAVVTAATGVALGAQLGFTLKHDRAALLSRLGPVACFAGLWIGALPVIRYLWIEQQRLVSVQDFVSWDDFVWQLGKVIHTGIPILLGLFHNWKADVASMPAWLRWAVHGIYWAGLFLAAGAAVRARIKGGRRLEGLWFFLVLFGVVLATFSVSARGTFVAEPRYVLILYFVFVMTTGWLVSALRHRGGRLALAAPLVLGALVAANVWTCLDLPRLPLAPWTGVERGDLELIARLKQQGIARVSCRFSPHSYWLAYRLTYEAREEVVFAPANFPGGGSIRSRRHQQWVDGAPARAYLVPSHEAPALEARIRKGGAAFKMLRAADYTVFHDLQPDVLDPIPWQQYIAEQDAVARRGK